ncbi:MMPL family transporter, partial [Paraconexibacter sp.]|uniref:MMPL family transporter n=1 Tax=Paraconexibacter sp. TaxID=2949640 RepID=UPI00356AA03D
RAATAGGTDLADGLARLTSGSSALVTGVQRLASGTGTLAGGLDTGAQRTRILQAGLRSGADAVDASGLPSQRDADALSRLGRSSPNLGRSGYLMLAAADGAPAARRAQATFAISLQRGGRAGRILVVPTSGPNDDAAHRLGQRLRAELPALSRATGTDVALGGTAAVLGDYDEITSARLIPLIVTLTVVTALALVVLFRSLLLPFVAVGLNLVTVGAAFGVLALLFQGNAPLGGPGFIDAVSVSGIFTVLFGLSIDYQVFLVLRMREGYLDTGDPRAAIAYGLERTAKVVTGAAAIMLGVFCAFSVAEVSALRQFGIGLMVAVLIDATVVRLVLLPALMRALGDRCWWLPDWLDARLPHLDVEGEDHAHRRAVAAA